MKDKILHLLGTHPKNSFSLRDLVLRLKINNKQKLKGELLDLVRAGEIVHLKGKRYAISRKARSKTGKLQVTSKGFGFVITGENDQDIFISRAFMSNAINGDTVEVEITSAGRDGRLKGRIKRIVNRRTETFVGPVFKRFNSWYQSTSPLTPERGIMLTGKGLKDLKQGEVVVTKVEDWSTSVSPIKVSLKKVLGASKDPAIDFEIIKEKFSYDAEFPERVETEMISMKKRDHFKIIDNRTDLRNIVTFTIDPESARDFDDALSVIKTEKGYDLWVHIADVSHFVQLNSETDREAMNRGTSVYFNEGVIPMLPEILSADLCSLNPQVDRFAMTISMSISNDMDILNWKVFESVIHSNERFTYENVQDIIDGKEDHKLKPEIMLLKEIAEKLFRNREEKGSIDFDIPEPVFALDGSGIPHEIRPSERLASHRIVEECMLLANRVVAEGFGQNGPFVFRIHDKPDPVQIEKLILLLKTLGVPVPKNINPTTSRGMRDLLLLVEDSPHRSLIDGIALRSMTKAKYSIKRNEHFGLAFQFYTHFTSPIRRYPDLLVHRFIKLKTRGEKNNTLEQILNKAVEISNETEMNAQKAEREYIKLKQLRWLNTQIGEIFEGVISGVVSVGFFVELNGSMAEGLVHIDSLDHDTYSYEEDQYMIKGRNTKKIYQLGQNVKIRVVSVDIDQLRANFYLEPSLISE